MKAARYVRSLAAAVVLFNTIGNYCLSRGMRSLGQVDLRIFGNLWVLSGVMLLIAWLIAQLALLSWADLTYVLPLTAMSYVLSAVLGAVALHEHVSAARWGGTVLITAGVLVVGGTRARTSPGQGDGVK